MKRKFKLFTLLTLFLCIISCNNEDIYENENNPEYQNKSITKIQYDNNNNNNTSNSSQGSFPPPLWISHYGYSSNAGSWKVWEEIDTNYIIDFDGDGIDDYTYETQESEIIGHPRAVADVNGDGKADIIGFSDAGVKVSLSNGNSFNTPVLWINNYGQFAGNWKVDRHPRAVADVNGDGKADIIGFSDIGVKVSLSNGSSFSTPTLWNNSYGRLAGGWSQYKHPRTVADVNGDGKADIIGFSDTGATVSLSNGTSFGAPKLWIKYYGVNTVGWSVTKHPRTVADVNGDGKADVIGFSDAGATVSLSNGNSFGTPKLWINDYGQVAGVWRVNKTPRIVADVNGDGKSDIIGFAVNGVRVSLSNGNSFSTPKSWINYYGEYAGNWRVDKHPRVLGDVNGDGKFDIIGFAEDGARVLISEF